MLRYTYIACILSCEWHNCPAQCQDHKISRTDSNVTLIDMQVTLKWCMNPAASERESFWL